MRCDPMTLLSRIAATFNETGTTTWHVISTNLSVASLVVKLHYVNDNKILCSFLTEPFSFIIERNKCTKVKWSLVCVCPTAWIHQGEISIVDLLFVSQKYHSYLCLWNYNPSNFIVRVGLWPAVGRIYGLDDDDLRNKVITLYKYVFENKEHHLNTLLLGFFQIGKLCSPTRQQWVLWGTVAINIHTNVFIRQ